MKQTLLEMVQVTVLFHTFPPITNCFFLVYIQKRKRAKTAKPTPRTPKPLLRRQNWVKKAGGPYNLVPGGHLLGGLS